MKINMFGKEFEFGFKDPIQEQPIQPPTQEEEVIAESIITEDILHDNSKTSFFPESDIVGISEAVIHNSPANIKKMIDSNEIRMSSLLDALKSDYNEVNTYNENIEMSKDTIVGSAMELMSGDMTMTMPSHKKVVRVQSDDPKLEEFLNNFLDNNIKIEDRVWEWAFEIVKHGDFKLRRLEYSTGKKANNVFYENVVEGYKISRIEYLGTILGYLDNEEGESVLEDSDSFVHFLSARLPNRKKIKIKVKDNKGEMKDVKCYKVSGTSLMDNARYIYRVVNLLDNMLIMSRVARSTQYNIVKIEVGNASPRKTQDIIMDVRRSIEGSTRMNKNTGIKTDPSPIPVNSNVYIPTREGKGDIVVDSINENVDVKSIVDIDHFRNKEFATLKTPKAYLGFEEELPGSMGNASLLKLDIRYARNVQVGQKILRNGLKELCNNYLRYRGRIDDVDNFEIELRSIVSAEDSTKAEEFSNNMSIFDAMSTLMGEFGDYVSKPKLLNLVMGLLGVNMSDIAKPEMMDFLDKLKDDHRTPEPEIESQEEGEEDDQGFY